MKSARPGVQNFLSEKLQSGSTAAMDLFHHRENKEKRRSLTDMAFSTSKKNPKTATPTPTATLAIEMESPPLVFYGSTTQSSGALLSGQLNLSVAIPSINITVFEMKLFARVTTKRPDQHAHNVVVLQCVAAIFARRHTVREIVFSDCQKHRRVGTIKNLR